jgi:hypothetical protein
MKKYIFTLPLLFISALCFAQVNPEYDVLGDLKSKQWYCDQDFKNANLRSQKVLILRACNDSVSSYKTPVMWIEGNEFMVQYPDGSMFKYKYVYENEFTILYIYSIQNPSEPFKYQVVYILSGSAFALRYTDER